jgi:DNA-binding Lrp family transcriptional regulator
MSDDDDRGAGFATYAGCMRNVAMIIGAMTVAGCHQDGKSDIREGVKAAVPISESAAPVASVSHPEVTAAASVSASPAPPMQRVRRLSDDEVKRRITPLLRANEQLAHAVFAGPFGPEKGATLVLTKVSGEPFPVLGGWVLVGGEDKRTEVPEVWSPGLHIFEKVEAVIPLDVDEDPALEIIILSTILAGGGPYSGHYLPWNLVLDWDGAKFVQLSAVESKIGEAKDAAQVKKALGK